MYLLIILDECLRCKVCDEINQYLILECNARLKGEVIFIELYSPLGEATRELRLV